MKKKYRATLKNAIEHAEDNVRNNIKSKNWKYAIRHQKLANQLKLLQILRKAQSSDGEKDVAIKELKKTLTEIIAEQKKGIVWGKKHGACYTCQSDQKRILKWIEELKEYFEK